MTLAGRRPEWLTFDCYGTLIQWDEGLIGAAGRIVSRKRAGIDPQIFVAVYDRHEHALEQRCPHLTFKDVSAKALRLTMTELSLPFADDDAQTLTSSIGRMSPFPEVVGALSELKAAGFKLAIVSNTDDAIIAGNVAQLGGHIDRVITAQQAQAYKPSARIFEHAWGLIGASKDRLVHVCASPHLDLVAARDLGFRAVWIDRGTKRMPLPDYKPAATASSLDGLLTLLAEAGWMLR